MRTISVSLAGTRARALLEREARGVVLSSHATGLYCALENGEILLFCDEDLGVVPFGLGCAKGIQWKDRAPGTVVANAPARMAIRLGESVFSYAVAATPAPAFPALPREMLTRPRLRAGIDKAVGLLGIKELAAKFPPCHETGPQAVPSGTADGPGNIWDAALGKSLREITDYCRGQKDADPGELVASIIGLGPGLTPLGDDILCGLMAAGCELEQVLPCRALSRISGTLVPPLLPLLSGATGRQSAAFLKSAAAGEFFGLLDAVLVSLILADATAMQNALTALLAVGHTSGSGMLLGLFLATEMALS